MLSTRLSFGRKSVEVYEVQNSSNEITEIICDLEEEALVN